jgi:hypothetical protein
MNIYTKQPISIDDQIAKLRSLGLIIADEDKARKTLSEVNKMKHIEGIPMTPEELEDYEKVWKDMEENIKYCETHPCKLSKSKV